MERQRADGVFEPTYTIMSGSAVFGMPEVLQDEEHGLWSFKQARGGKRVVLTYADIESCAIVEKGTEASAPRPEGAKGILRVLANPSAISRDNAARRGKTCLGLSVEIELKPPLAVTLELPVWQRPVRRTERLYREVREQAEAIKARIDGMIAAAGSDEPAATAPEPAAPAAPEPTAAPSATPGAAPAPVSTASTEGADGQAR